MKDFILQYWTTIVPILVSVASIIINYRMNKIYNKALPAFNFFAENGFMWLKLRMEGNSYTKKWELKVNSYIFNDNVKTGVQTLRMGELAEIHGVSFNPKEEYLFCLGEVNWDIRAIKICYKYKTNRLFKERDKRTIPCQSERILDYTKESHKEAIKSAFLGFVNYFTGNYYNTMDNLAMSKGTERNFMSDLAKTLKEIIQK